VTVKHSPEVLERFHAELELVEVIANLFMRDYPKANREELVSVGQEALFRAARRFDPTRGASFKTYAYKRVEGAMRDFVRDSGPYGRYHWKRIKAMEEAVEICDGDWQRLHDAAPSVPKSAALAERSFEQHLASLATAASIRLDFASASSEESTESAGIDDPEQAHARAETLARIERLCAERAITELQQEILRRHYVEDVALNEIARQRRQSPAWISRQHAHAIAMLTKLLVESGFG
jgi:RNA polymerase sigma factor for flagellar operon FliA